MKKIIFFLVLWTASFVQHGFAQDQFDKNNPTSLLALYYEVKDALVNGNPDLAAAKAAGFIHTLQECKELPGVLREALLQQATSIAQAKDIKTQRVRFADFSDDMFLLAKTVKLSAATIYQVYCPMQKANWLSSETAVKNPYYGSMMLTCGKVTETLE